MTTAVFVLGIGLGIGLVVGALGAGGGILTIPVLVYLLNQDPHTATAESLIVVSITAATSMIHHMRVQNIAWRDGTVFGLISILGAVGGSIASPLVDANVLLLLFAVMLIGVAVAMARKAIRTRRHEDGTGESTLDSRTSTTGHPEADETATPRYSIPKLLSTGVFTGTLTGFFGVGGGFIVVPMLVIALGLAMRKATGTSLLIMIIATLSSIATRVVNTGFDIDWTVTLLFTVGAAVGGLAGGPLSAKMRQSTLTTLFAVLLASVAIFTLVETLLG